MYFDAGGPNETNGLFGSRSAVPEPSSILLVGIGGIAVAVVQFRRRKARIEQANAGFDRRSNSSEGATRFYPLDHSESSGCAFILEQFSLNEVSVMIVKRILFLMIVIACRLDFGPCRQLGVTSSPEAIFKAIREGNDAEALRLIQDAATAQPSPPPARLELARVLFAANQSAKGRRSLEQAAAESPDDARVYLMFGSLALGEGRYSDARLNGEKALSLLEESKLDSKTARASSPRSLCRARRRRRGARRLGVGPHSSACLARNRPDERSGSPASWPCPVPSWQDG